MTQNLRWVFVLAGIFLFDYFCTENLDPYFLEILIYAGINITLAVSLNLVNGFTGQFSMGHAGFMAIGAYASAYVSMLLTRGGLLALDTPLQNAGIFILVLTLGGLVAGLFGFIVGLPSLRLKGDYLAIVTLGFSEIIRVMLLNIDAVGGARGMPGIFKLSSFFWVYAVATITVFFTYRLITSTPGRALLSVREDEIAAEAVGVNTTKAKAKAFVASAFFAGLAGGLFAHYLGFLSPASFDIARSFEIITMVVLGGMGSISGSVIAALVLTALKEALRPLQYFTGTDYRMVIYSFLLIVMMLTRPRGLLGNRELNSFAPIQALGRKISSLFSRGATS